MTLTRCVCFTFQSCWKTPGLEEIVLQKGTPFLVLNSCNTHRACRARFVFRWVVPSENICVFYDLRSASDTCTFITPYVNMRAFGQRSFFFYAAPSVWNSLPQLLRHSDSSSALRTHLFRKHFTNSQSELYPHSGVCVCVCVRVCFCNEPCAPT